MWYVKKHIESTCATASKEQSNISEKTLIHFLSKLHKTSDAAVYTCKVNLKLR